MSIPYKISVLVFLRDKKGRHLLLRREKAPNIGLWSPLGGKLDLSTGESPFACACRETHEESGLEVGCKDLHLFGYIAEKNYEGEAHWLMFLFDCRVLLEGMPDSCPEGDIRLIQKKRNR